MKPQVKLGLYVVAVVGTLVFGMLFFRAWRQADAGASAARAGDALPAPGATSAVAPPQLEGVAGVPTEGPNSVLATTAPTDAVATVEEPGATNRAAAGEATAEQEAVPLSNPAVQARGLGRLVLWGLLAIGALVGLGMLVAYDLASYAGHRATQALFDDRGADIEDTEYEAIEKVYGEGEYLEAVRMLREFLKSKPKAIHAQIRIAEIYEKDLNNPLAAALEYEEVIQKPFEPGRRGWTAIHLVNLYNRLDRPAEAVALMQRVVMECPGTPAAGKAAERLLALGEEVPEVPADPRSGDTGGLPPGFRPKR